MAVAVAACRGRRRIGFTLLEMSIVLVIIGLLVGGILVGRDLVKAAGDVPLEHAVRAPVPPDKFDYRVLRGR